MNSGKKQFKCLLNSLKSKIMSSLAQKSGKSLKINCEISMCFKVNRRKILIFKRMWFHLGLNNRNRIYASAI